MLQPTVPIETTPSECVGDRGDGIEASEKHDCDHDTTPELTPSSGICTGHARGKLYAGHKPAPGHHLGDTMKPLEMLTQL